MSAKRARNVDVSILIVHTFKKKSLRQTLRGIVRSAPRCAYEIIIIDNNPPAGVAEMLKKEFPWIRHLPQAKNLGFGGAMNQGINIAKGEYVLIFNPDIVVSPGALDELKAFMDDNADVGIAGPKLTNPDGSLQYSCVRQPTFMLPAYRRTFLGKLPHASAAVEEYLMQDVSHNEIINVDSLMGAALFTRRAHLDQVGLFDEQFFMYYEDNDLCRRFWENGFRVVYMPMATMMHYHGRASAKGGLLSQLTNRFAWIQIQSFLRYYKKYKDKENPRLAHSQHGRSISDP